MFAMHLYASDHVKFPPAAISSKDGQPLLSWRVAVLPYLEQEDLYKEFKLDEPWDSRHNKKLLAKMPSVYAPVGVKTNEPHTTFYQVFKGKRTVFESQKGIFVGVITGMDGPSNTVLIAEAGEPVPWTKPADMPYYDDEPLPKLGGLFKDGFHVALCDGQIRFLKRTINEDEIRALITYDDWDINRRWNNLRELAKAVRKYDSVVGHLPPHAIYSQDGKPLLSWRVAILPYLGRPKLYKEFKLDESWDSSHNKNLLAKMPGFTLRQT